VKFTAFGKKAVKVLSNQLMLMKIQSAQKVRRIIYVGYLATKETRI
jgi:hypothetical protein